MRCKCPLLTQSGHDGRENECLFLTNITQQCGPRDWFDRQRLFDAQARFAVDVRQD